MVDPTRERGCFISTDWKVTPFQNVSDNVVNHIQMGDGDFGLMADLVMKGRLYGWIHSHPHGPAHPSVTDLRCHRLPVNMLIYAIAKKKLVIIPNALVPYLDKARQDDDMEFFQELMDSADYLYPEELMVT